MKNSQFRRVVIRAIAGLAAAGLAVGMESLASAETAAVGPERQLPLELSQDYLPEDRSDEPATVDDSVSGEPAAAEAMPAAVLPTNSCSYADAGTGSHARTICWLNFDGLNTLGADLSEPVSMTLPGGYVLSATLSSLGADGGALTGENRWRSRDVSAAAFPTWSGAFLGNRVNGSSFYTGVAGKPALYQARENSLRWGQAMAVTTLTLSDIQLKLDGTPVSGYSMVVADAETTDSRESIDWTTSGGDFALLPNSPTSQMGNACRPTFTITGKSARCAANNNSDKTGTPMLVTAAPGAGKWQVSQKLTGEGRQGVAFGLMFAKASAEVVLDGRIAGADQFTVSMQAPQLGSQPIKATTAGSSSAGATARTGERELVVPIGQSTPIAFSLAAANPGWQLNYTEAWSCSRGGNSVYTGPTAPAANQTTVSVGELMHCTVTLTPPKLTLEKVVENRLGGVAVPADWTLTAAGSRTITGKSGAAGVTSVPVAPGSYTLSESGPAGYAAVGWVCDSVAAGGGATGTVEVAKGKTHHCVVTNQDRPGTLAIVKAFDGSVPAGSGTATAFTGGYTCAVQGGPAITGTWQSSGAGPATLTRPETGFQPVRSAR